MGPGSQSPATADVCCAITGAMGDQLSLNFDGAPEATPGLTVWRERRRAQIDVLAVRSGLPIGHMARIWLISGVLVEGKLLLAQEDLILDQRRSPELRLQVGLVDFCVAEIESCVRID